VKLSKPIIIIHIVALLLGNVAFASDSVPGELLVKYRAGTYSQSLNGELAKIGWAKIRVASDGGMNVTMESLRNSSDILRVEPNTYGQFLSEPDDPSFGMQWYLPDVEVPDAWEKSLGEDIIIGVVDSGVDLDHQDLADNILPDGWDFGDDDDDPNDMFDHGTKVAGVIAAIQNNGIGISGCAPEAKILPVKISQGSTGSFTDETVAEGIIYAADFGVDIINLSLGWTDKNPHQVVRDAIDYAVERGIVLIAAAGNKYGPVWFPANYESVISVSGTDQEGRNDRYAFGPELDLVAPGHNIRTTSINMPYYDYISGTSFSCAIVTGITALLSYRYPHLTPEEIRDYLIVRADDLGEEGRDDTFGYGKVNARKSLMVVSEILPPTIRGSRYLPLLYLTAIAGEDTRFSPFSRVSFDSDQVISLGPPLVAFPRFLLQLVLLHRNPSEESVTVTVTTESDQVKGYGLLSTGLFPWASETEELSNY
jgi:subtilisin family serine protease